VILTAAVRKWLDVFGGNREALPAET
jgi:hypothetical protein